ncbi:cell wall-binding repeat-containing protein [Clostridium ihumii]|uniref:cell wall-binding repeat-containing protein n=1 Tax=Clostridium ihumii TaxID=1470356 RepID=UPI003D351DBA
MKKSSRVISTLLLGATLTSFSTGVFAVESQKVVKEKLAGATRYETNLAVSAKWEKAETVVLVQGYAIPDALAATPLAKQKDAPILLTETDKLTKSTADEIKRLGAKNAIIVGGEGVVSKEVEKDLEAMNVKVSRLAGPSRFETSEAVVKEMGEVSKVAVVNGYGESDALSIAAPAAKEGMAIVLSGKDELKGSKDAVKNAKEKFVIGGTGVVSEKLEKEIGAKRLGGETRNETNAAILKNFYNEKEIKNLYVAKDGNPNITELVDALGVGPLAGKEANPVMLAGAKASAGQIEYLKDKTAKVVTEVGGGINQSTLAEIIKALEVKDVTPEEPTDDVEVSGVQVLNANQIEIKFSEKVDKDSAENIENYEVKEDGKSDNILEASKYAPTKGKTAKGAIAEVQEDGQTVIVTLPQAYLAADTNFFNQETIRIKVENVMTADKSSVMEKYENKKVKLFDNTLPELKEVKQVGPKDFNLVFSEPVTAQNSSAIVSAIRIDGGKYSCTAKTRVDNDSEDKKIDANVVRITTPSEVEEGEHTLTIKENKLTDYAGLKLEAVDTKFQAKKAAEDLQGSVYKTSNEVINEKGDRKGIVTLDFNREVENAETIDINGKKQNDNVSYYLDYENDGYKATSATMIDGKLQLEFDRDIPSGNHKILVVYKSEKKDKVQDLWENELASREIAFTVAKDTVAPTAKVTYNKNDKKIEVKFSKKVDQKEATTQSNYQLKDEKGNYKNIGKIEQKDGNSLVYRIDAKDLSGKYTLTIKGNKIHDTSVEKNAMKETSFELDTLDSLAPSITAIRYGGDKDTNKIYVEFSEDMKTEGEGSILDKSLYHLNYTQDTKNDSKVDKTLDEIEDAEIDLDGDNAVIITLPENIVVDKDGIATKDVKVKVGRVCDASGNFVSIKDGITNIFGDDEKAISDKEVCLLKGSNEGKGIDDTDILEKDKNVNIVDTKKMEVYVQGKVSSVVAEKIQVTVDGKDYKATKAKTQSYSLKVAEGKYVETTKLTLEFENKIFKEGAVPSKIKFDDKAIVTNLQTESKATPVELFAVNKKVVKYVDDTAVMIVEKNAKGENIAKEVRFNVTTPVKNVTKDTFKVEGYNVDSATTDNKGYTVVLTLDGKSTCEPCTDADIDVELAQPIYDMKDNKTEEMDVFQIDVVKYAEEATIASIEKLEDVSVNKSKLAEYKLPETVKVTYTNKEVKEAKVEWNIKEADLKVGPNTLVGKVAGTDLKANLIVIVVDDTEKPEVTTIDGVYTPSAVGDGMVTVKLPEGAKVTKVVVDGKVATEENSDYVIKNGEIRISAKSEASKIVITINDVETAVNVKNSEKPEETTIEGTFKQVDILHGEVTIAIPAGAKVDKVMLNGKVAELNDNYFVDGTTVRVNAKDKTAKISITINGVEKTVVIK